MFALCVTVCEILTVELYVTLILTFRTRQCQTYICAIGKVVCHLVFVGDHNVRHIYHNLREIRNRNVRDLGLDHCNVSISDINMPMERPYATFYLLAKVMFAQCLPYLSPFMP